MLDVRQAATAAMDYFKGLYEPDAYRGLLLEEVELSADDRFWFITLGYDAASASSPLSVLSRGGRRYQIFKIDSETGQVVSMKIREVASSDAA